MAPDICESPVWNLHHVIFPAHKILRWLIDCFIIGIQPLGRSGQRPEFNQATGMALVRYILDKFLGVACHCFPPLFLDVLTFHHQVPPRPPRRERSQRRKWELWARMLSGNFAEMTTSTTWDRRLYFPSEGRRAEDLSALKNPTASAGFEPANLGTKGQHATPRPPKPLAHRYLVKICASLPLFPTNPKWNSLG